MNPILKETAVSYLNESLARLPEGNQRIFKLMYGRNDGKRSVEDTEAMPISDVIAEIPDEKLDWAMQQAINSMTKSQYNN